MPVAPPYLVAINLTRRCNLRCAHCYLDAGARSRDDPAELNTAEVYALLDDIAGLSDEIMVVLTGGEPLLRRDLAAIALHGADLGLMIVLGSNGMLLDGARALSLKQAGVKGVGISVDSLDPDRHDAFRGAPGAFARTMAGMDACRAAGLAFQIHFSVTDDTAGELDAMIAFARSAGAIALNVFFLICTGRGQRVSNISKDGYDRVLRRLTRAAHDETEIMVRAKCAPHFKRMAIELDPDWPITRAHGYEAGGCLAGTRYARVTPQGDVTPCPYMEIRAGSLREQRFGAIWRDAPVFAQLRTPRLQGRCGACEYAGVCGGCRARPLADGADLMGEDSLCTYVPGGGESIAPAPAPGLALSWTDDAQARLDHVPAFVRRFVRQRAEAHAKQSGESQVTAEHLHALARQRLAGLARPVRPAQAAQPGRAHDRD
ncbi:MAG: radical SAM protein [Hyphomicrobiales bacterium]|nr:radical SAM protein [Hyphomicrobiales bacterium]